MANSNSKAAEQAEQALRKLLLNMRNGTNANHTQALANFKAAVLAYNKAQVNAVNAVKKAIVNPTARKVNGAAGALGEALNTSNRLKRAQSVLAQAAAAEAKEVPIGKNNSNVTRNNTGKKQGFLGRVGGAVRRVGGAVAGGARATRGAVAGGARATRGAVVGGARVTGGALGGLFRPRSRPVKPNSETARLIDEPPPPNKRN